MAFQQSASAAQSIIATQSVRAARITQDRRTQRWSIEDNSMISTLAFFTEAEAELAYAMWLQYPSQNINEFQWLFVATLRMLNSPSQMLQD